MSVQTSALGYYMQLKGLVCFKRPLDGLQKDKFYLSFCGALQNAVIARH